jgi:hypothetical protein
MATAYFDIVNSNILVPYSSCSNYDMVIRTEGPAQRIFIGNSNGAFVPALVISSNFVGIGKSNPAYALDINGNVSLGSVASNAVGYINAGNLGMFRNRLVNGDMRINNAGFTSSNITGNASITPYDNISVSCAITTGSITTSNITLTSSDLPFTAGGVQNSLRITAAAAVTNYSYIIPSIPVPATSIAGWAWGTSSGSPIVVSFWFRTNIANSTVLDITIRNLYNSQWNNYSGTFTVTNSTGWQYVTINVPAPPTGSFWNSGVGAGFDLQLCSRNTTTALASNTWNVNSSGASGSTGAVLVWGTINNYVEFAAVQLERGTIATPYEFRPPQVESLLNNNIVLGSVANNTVGNVCAGNIGMFRNRIINGDMRIAQRGTGATVTGSASGTVFNCADRFYIYYSTTTGALTTSLQTIATTDAPYGYGFRRSLRLTASTACTNYSFIYSGQAVEANNMADFNWGSSVAVPVVVSFWLRSNIATGKLVPVTIRTGGYSYNITVTIVASGAWQYVSAVVPPLTTGTIPSGTDYGLDVFIGSLNQGSLGSAVNTWQSGNFVGSTAANTSINLWATLNNYVEFTGLQLEKGTMATPFEFRPYQIELQLCQRYYYQTLPADVTGGASPIIAPGIVWSTSSVLSCVTFPVPMRTTTYAIKYSAGSPFNVLSGGATFVCTSLNLSDGNSMTCARVDVAMSGTATIGYSALLRGTTSSAWVGFDAEL